MVASRDIVVAGAGLVGCAVAFELARRGARVRVVDGRDVGRGATFASAGMLAPYAEADAGSDLLALCEAGLALYDDFVARLTADSGEPVPYVRRGSLHVAYDAVERSRLVALHAALQSRGVAAEWRDAHTVQVHEPQLSDRASGGLWIQAHGQVDPPEVADALRRAAERHGAVFVRGTITRIGQRGGQTVVHVDGGEVSCDRVVLATGAWSRTIDVDGASTHPPVMPVRGQTITLQWRAPMPACITWDDRCYTVPWAERLLVGATVEHVGFDESTTATAAASLREAAARLFPGAADAALIDQRSGLRPNSADPMPLIGWSCAVPGLFYATAHYRNGALLAPLTARLAADALLDGQDDPLLALTAPARFGTL